MNFEIDLNALIIPGKSAGGFKLGIHLNETNEKTLNAFQRRGLGNAFLSYESIHLKSEDVLLYFKNKILTQIGLIGNYKGKLESGLGLVDYANAFEKIYGKITEGEEDELIFSNLKGLCFEVEDNIEINSDNWKALVPTLAVTEIFIYDERLTKSIILGLTT